MGLCRRLAHELLHNAVTSWQAIMPHPHIVTLRSVINSRDFDDLNDLICAHCSAPYLNSARVGHASGAYDKGGACGAVVYDYHPGAESLESRYFPTSVRLSKSPSCNVPSDQLCDRFECVHSYVLLWVCCRVFGSRRR